MVMNNKTIAYLRVSTVEQDLEKNKADILKLANEVMFMTSTAAGSRVVSKMRLARSEASEKESKERRSVSIFSGRGRSLNVISHRMPRLPIEPTMSFDISYPETFFTVLPPAPAISPLGATTLTPRIISRGRL